MNSLWLQKMFEYKNSSNSFLTAQFIIQIKLNREATLLKRYKKPITIFDTSQTKNIRELMLLEARAAKHFWSQVSSILPEEYNFKHRKQHSKDIFNNLLDVGFHHLVNLTRTIIVKYNASPNVGLMHTAHRSKSEPLLYDLMEMFRSDLVVSTSITFLIQKKIILTKLDQKDIGNYVYKINKKLEKKFYIKELRYCVTYKYYMELQIEKFIKAVNHNQSFIAIHLPTRHDNRCSQQTSRQMIDV